MSKINMALLCLALLSPRAAGAAGKDGGAAGGRWDARLDSYAGSVLVKPAGTKRWINARKGLPLSQGDTVRTGKKSAAYLSLDGRGIVSLNASTELDLKDLKRKDSSLILRTGRFIMKITGLKKRAERLSVRTPTAVAAVRGTEFAVAYSKDLAETLVNVFEEGEVLVTSLDESGNAVGESIVVIPRHEVRVRKEMEAMTLTQSPPSRYGDPGIFSVRKKLSTLEKNYEPLKEREREGAREEAFGKKRGEKGSAGYAEAGEEDAGDTAGAYGKAPRKKGKAGEESREEDAEAAAGAKVARQGGYARQGAAAAGEEDEAAAAPKRSHGKGKRGGDDDEDGTGFRFNNPHGGRKGGGFAGGGSGGNGGRKKSGSAGSSLGGGLGGKSGTSGGDGGRSKSASAGGDGGPLLRPGADGALSRPTSASDKGVDTIVSRVQEKLASTGNDGAISSAELRTLVIGAAKTSTSDLTFLTTLNTSIADRLAATQTVTPVLPVSTLSTKTSVTTSPTISITKPSITSPTIGTKDTTVIKKTP